MSLLGPDGQPLVNLTGAGAGNREQQKVWRIGNVESPPLVGNPQEILDAIRQVTARGRPMGVAMDLMTPLEIIGFQATSIVTADLEKRLSKLEKLLEDTPGKKRLEARMRELENKLSLLQGMLEKDAS